MNLRSGMTFVAAALALILSGAAIGAAAVALHHVDGPSLLDPEAGAIDYGDERPLSP